LHKIIRSKKNRILYMAILLAVAGVLTACAFNNQPISQQEKKSTGFIAADPGVYDSTDTAVVTAVDTESKTLTFKNMSVNRQYTLQYDGASYFYDKYGKALSASQVKPGEIVDLTFFKSKKRLNTLQRSKTGFVHEKIGNYRIDEEKHQISVGSGIYAYTDDMVILSDGKPAELMEINPIDRVTVYGIDSEVYSLVVEKGHGYVRLKNEEYFYGGFIEIGNDVVQRVTENMLLVVPEGIHQVVISNKGTSGVKEIDVRRNIELTLDVGDLKGAEPKYGSVVFSITPADAILYVDGEKADYSKPIRLEYGIHQMILMKAGYSTLTQYIKVAQESAGIEASMELDPDVSGNDIDVSGNDVESPESSEYANPFETEAVLPNEETGNAITSTLSYYVTVDSPTDVELYLDGNYVGITPCSFKKETGSHVLTLRKTGYTSKSYTIKVDSEEKNISYSFLDLTLLEE